MAGSEAEEAIRADLEAWLHQHMPAARVIHELVVGGCRADVAAVERDRISLFEIKSERDTLDRLAEQIRQFSRSAHWCCVVAARRWFDERPYNNGAPRLAWTHEMGVGGVDVWCHPQPTERASNLYQWDKPAAWRRRWRPHTMHMLEVLWRDELAAEASRFGLQFKARTTKPEIMAAMWDAMNGAQITSAVCRQLRIRQFPRADAPMFDEVTP